MSRAYYLGLDMGTSSVGWAVTDENYNLLRAKGKDLWGIREFEEATTSVDRRTHRINRRRRQRQLVRIGLLKEYFADEILKVDPNFYARLENSKYYLEDKDENVRTKNGIFNDKSYSDVDYYKEYPTIYHLRAELIKNKDEHDVRLVFLAILNLFKRRGHFLNAGLSTNESERTSQEVYNELIGLLDSNLELSFPTEFDAKLLESIIGSRDMSRTQRQEKLCSELGFTKTNKKEIVLVKMMCGLKINAINLFEDVEIAEDKKIEICFNDFNYDEKSQEILEGIGENYYQIVELAKELYDKGLLAGIIHGHKYLSDARVDDYEKHKKDLKILKNIIVKYGNKEDYDKMFREYEQGTYSAYVNSTNSNKKFRRDIKNRKAEDLYKTINKLIKDYPEDDEVRYIREEISKETLLPKQLTSANGVIPYQVHYRELKKILANAEEYLDFLKVKDDTGLTVSEKIMKIFSFQIPYYIGPTTTESAKHGGNGWVCRKEEGMVLPWNIEQKIDMKKTSEEFISRMVRKCTYIAGKQVLPKGSLVYERYCVLNEINNIKVNNEKISVELKQQIYRDLFENGKKVTRKKLFIYLFNKGVVEEISDISGVDENLNSSLSTYAKFYPIFGEKMKTDSYKKMVEDIVFWSTIYGDAKGYLKEQIKEHYSDKIADGQLKKILGLKFKDWGNLSKEFLELGGADLETGEIVNLIGTMWDTNYNMMELIHSDNYTFATNLAAVENNIIKDIQTIEASDLDDMYFSAPVKRMVWQTLLIIKELTEVLGGEPEKIFIEMTRSSEEIKKRTNSRKQQFLELYKKVKEEGKDWAKVIETADSDGSLRSKKMYLYLTQKGRCMYSGESIDLDNLFNDNLYDIDHIYPRHYVKDDNINNNLVLVKKQINANKTDNYPLDASIVNNRIVFWKELKEGNFISEEKYRRLTGRNPFTEDQMAGFIARQLVETSQGTKGVADLLKQALPNSMLVYSKASNVSEFRKQFDLLKCRSVNEFHHANDAYLNIVVGNVYNTKFTQNPRNFVKEYLKDKKVNHYNLDKMFDRNVERNGKVAWIASDKDGRDATIKTVKKMMAKNTPLMTRYSFVGHGGLANETLYSKNKAKEEGYMPLKTKDKKLADVTKYGGFTSMATAYFFLVQHELKGKIVRTIESLPIVHEPVYGRDKNTLEEYCLKILGLVNPSVRFKKIKIQSLLRRNGYLVHLSGKTGNQIALRNAINLHLDYANMKIIREVFKAVDNNNFENIDGEKNIRIYEFFVKKFSECTYINRPNNVWSILDNGFDKYRDLKKEDQCRVLIQIMELLKVGVTSADLSGIGGAAKSGTMKISKNITDSNELVLVNQSVTGIYENEVDLLTV